MKKRGKKLLSYLLTLVLVLGIVPWISLTAKAYEKKFIRIVDATAVTRAYEPGNQDVTISYVRFEDEGDGHIWGLEKDKDYTVTGTMSDDTAGSKDVTVTVTLKNADYIDRKSVV